MLKPGTYFINENETANMNKIRSFVNLDGMPPNMKAAITKQLKTTYQDFNFASLEYWMDLLVENSLLTPEIKTEIAALLLSGKHE